MTCTGSLRHTFAVLFVLVGSVPPAMAQPLPSAEIIRPTRFEQPPVIDGHIDEEVWDTAARLDRFHQVYPGDNIEPSQRTTVLIGYDSKALYFAFRAFGPSGQVRATLAQRDAIANDDMIGVYLDTFRDRRRAYYIFFNPYGVQADGVYTEGQPEPDLTVDLVIESKGTIDADGYTVEVAIPFASLRRQTGDSVTWGLHVQRFIRRDRNEQISWMPLSRDRSSFLDQAGQLGPFRDVGGGRSLDVIPTVTATQARVIRPMSRPDGRVGAEAGLTVNLGITPTMNAALTVNPDFAQVEADRLELTVNERFPIFYDEKRPFFLEGIDLFQTPIAVIHTRTIVAPDYAIKWTGRHDRTTVGALAAVDGAMKAAVRVKREMGQESTVGVTATAIRDDSMFSNLVSADARLRFSDKTVMTTQLAGTFAELPFRDPDGDGFQQRYGTGLGYHARVERRSRRSLVAVTSSGSSPDYRADLGFTRRVNTNSVSVQTTYYSEPRPDARLISWSATNITFAQWDWQARANFIYVYPQVELNFSRHTYVRAFAFRDYERLFEEEFGVRRGPGREGAFAGHSERSTVWQGFSLHAGSRPSAALLLNVTLSSSWNVFDLDLGAGPRFPRVSPAALADPDAPLDPGPATRQSLGGSVTWNAADALRTSVEASRHTLVRNATGLTAYEATLVSWRANYQFTPFVFLRLRTDWDSATATRRGQYVFGWTPRPGTAIYAGYTGETTTGGVDVESGVAAPVSRHGRRAVFIKVSYLLRSRL